MSTFDYSAKRETAKKLIEKFGDPATIVVKGNSDGSGEPIYDAYGDEVPLIPDSTISGTVTPILNYKRMEIDGETIRAGDGYVFFYSDTAPMIGNFIDINDKTWRVVDIESLTSVGDVNVYRKLQLRTDE